MWKFSRMSVRPWVVSAIALAVVLVIVLCAPMLSQPCASQLMASSARYAAASRSGTSALLRARDAGRAEGLLEAARLSFSDSHIRRTASVDVLDFQRYLGDVSGEALAAGGAPSDGYARVAYGSEGRRRKLHA